MTDDIPEEYRGLVRFFVDKAKECERSIFEGIVRNRVEHVCKCHGAPYYIDPRDHYSGVPSCSVTRQALGPDDIETRPLPDLIFPGFTGERPANAVDWKSEKE